MVTTSSEERIEVGVTVPTGLRQGELRVTVDSEDVAYRRDESAVWFELPGRADAAVSWSIAVR